METIKCIVDSHHGIYVPKVFIQTFIGWDNISIEQATTLLNPDNEYYWETWEEVLNNASYTNGKHTWTLHHDGDLFAVREDHKWEEE